MIIPVKQSGKINEKNNRIVSVMKKVYSKCQLPYISIYLQNDQLSCQVSCQVFVDFKIIGSEWYRGRGLLTPSLINPNKKLILISYLMKQVVFQNAIRYISETGFV